jgi:hypothetical protein
MNDDEDLELQALQRQLDDAFQTTRPRAGFEDHLWAELQVRRPLLQRVQGTLAGLVGGARRVPAAPAAAVAVVLVLAIGVGLLSQGGLHFGGGASSTSGLAIHDQSGSSQSNGGSGAFGALPAPAARGGSSAPALAALPTYKAVNLYDGPVQLIWTGQLSMPVSSVPVFRFGEPTNVDADRFATAVAASPQSAELNPGELGRYSGDGFTLAVLASSPNAREPVYTITVDPSRLPSQGPSPTATADTFLSSHKLSPAWPNVVAVDQSGDLTYVIYRRQFAVPGYHFVYLVDPTGTQYGLQVQLQGGRPAMATGSLPVVLESADYRIISVGRAAQSAVASSSSGNGSSTPIPTVRLTSAELVYELAWAGDHSFYEPAFLFSGTFTYNGTQYVKRVLVPAVDPSQLSS